MDLCDRPRRDLMARSDLASRICHVSRRRPRLLDSQRVPTTNVHDERGWNRRTRTGTSCDWRSSGTLGTHRHPRAHPDSRRRASGRAWSGCAQPPILEHEIRRFDGHHRPRHSPRRPAPDARRRAHTGHRAGQHVEIDVWLPYQGDATQASRTDRSWRGVGRLAGGATIDSAHAQVTALAARMASEHSDTDRDRSARVGPTKDALGTPSTWIVLSMLVTVVGLLLVLACANVMNLLIARLIARRQELAMRTALGGTRGRIVTQIVSESLVLGLAGGALGLAVAWGGLVAVRTVAYRAVLPSACVRRSRRRIRRRIGFYGAARLLDHPHASHATRRPGHSSQRRHDAQHRQPKHGPRPVGAGRTAGRSGRHAPRRGSAHREIDADDDSYRYRLRGLGLALDAHRNPDVENRG